MIKICCEIDGRLPGCFPFADKDPFIIEKRPHVYFVGNQPEFKTTLVGGESLSKADLRVYLM